MSLTKAQLQAKLEALEAENQSLRNRTVRPRWASGVWPNKNRRTERDPAWQSTIRTVVPPDLEPGDVYYIDLSMWLYDPETSPVQYKKNPPKFSASLSPTDPSYALEREREYQKSRPVRA